MIQVLKDILKVLFWIVGVPIICLLLAYAYWAYKADIEPYKGKKFTKEAWAYADRVEYYYGVARRDYQSERCGMYTDLIKNHIKKSMTLAEVEDLLGKTNLVSYCMEKDIKCLIYSMGTCYGDGLTVSHGYFTVCFDKALKVVGTGKKDYSDEVCDGKLISCLLGDSPTCSLWFSKEKRNEKCTFKVDMW